MSWVVGTEAAVSSYIEELLCPCGWVQELQCPGRGSRSYYILVAGSRSCSVLVEPGAMSWWVGPGAAVSW